MVGRNDRVNSTGELDVRPALDPDGHARFGVLYEP